jgi:hypothetical protein
MATHGNVIDGKSLFLKTVEDGVTTGGLNLHDAVLHASQRFIRNTIQPVDIGGLPSVSAANLRSALKFDATDYDPSLGPCPNDPLQTSIINALRTIV